MSEGHRVNRVVTKFSTFKKKWCRCHSWYRCHACTTLPTSPSMIPIISLPLHWIFTTLLRTEEIDDEVHENYDKKRLTLRKEAHIALVLTVYLKRTVLSIDVRGLIVGEVKKSLILHHLASIGRHLPIRWLKFCRS